MASFFDSLSDEIFRIISSRGDRISMYDRHGNSTIDTYQARRFYMKKSKIMIGINENGSNSDVTLYLSKSVDLSNSKKLIDLLRTVTTRFNILLNVRTFDNDISPKDFAHEVEPVTESKMWGSRKSSYQKIGETKLIVRHSSPVSNEIFGSRSRNIFSFFVETKEGERFCFPVLSLHGARAFARHIDKGGRPHDETSNSIRKLAEELEILKEFKAYVRRFFKMDEEISSLYGQIKYCINEKRCVLRSLQGVRNYNRIVEQLGSIITENEVGPEAIGSLGGLLGISETHSLYKHLPVVAKNLKNAKQYSSQKICKDFVINDDYEVIIDNLITEYGTEDNLWKINGKVLTVYDQSVYDDVKEFLESCEYEYVINENLDKVLDFSSEWISSNKSNNKSSKETEEKAYELSSGIKKILKGDMPSLDLPADTPEFEYDTDKIRYVLEGYLEQDLSKTLAEFLRFIISKINSGKSLSPSEYIVASKLVELSGINDK